MNVETITYQSQGLKVKGWFMMPDSQNKDIQPVIYCRGGIRNVGKVRVDRMRPLVEKGYAVFAPHYRGNEGGEGREDFAGEDRFDVLGAIEWLQSQSARGIRPGTVPLIGFSRGALMVLRAAAEHPLAGPIVSWGGVSDLLLTYEQRVDLRKMLRRVVGHPHKQIDAYMERSPVYWSEKIHNPVMIVHGTEDQLVSIEHAYRLQKSLTKASRPPTMQILQGLGHHLPAAEDAKVWNMIHNFLSLK